MRHPTLPALVGGLAVVVATMLAVPDAAQAAGPERGDRATHGATHRANHGANHRANHGANHGAHRVAHFSGLTRAQRSRLRAVARDTWRFFGDAVDPGTHLPLDNVTYAGAPGSPAVPTGKGRYTSSANIGVYLWSLVAASDLGLVGRHRATRMARRTLRAVAALPSSRGFLYQWYDTRTGHVLVDPGQGECPGTGGTFDNCSFLSNVDNGWLASGLVVAGQALPGIRRTASRLLGRMDFSIFYDDRPQTHCNTDPAVPGNQPTGQMYGGYYVGSPPDVGDNGTHYYHNGALYSDPRISAYLGLGLHQMPGDVWWRTWRELPPRAPFADCASDPDFSWQGQWPMAGSWRTVTDPRSGKAFPVWEGAYTYPGSGLRFVPTYSGGMFEALMADEVVPETSWGPRSLGLADARTVAVQRRYATKRLGLPLWGMSPSSTPDDTGGYGIYGVEGLTFPYAGSGASAANPSLGLSQCHGCATEDVVTPHASFLALDVAPRAAYANLTRMRRLFPGVYGSRGFFDAVDPRTGAVGRRILVLDQSMIMAALDNALEDRALQRHFAAHPVSSAAHTYLAIERMGL